MIDDFLREHLRVGFRSIQPCPFGQAYVRFDFYHDRDRLINASPHVFGNVNISFVAHDNGWNHKKVTMNYEVWLMFLGYNVDHWNNRLVDKALFDWGSLVTWEEDHKCLSRILVKAKVVALQEIPWFIYCSENDEFEGDTWTIQCEILDVRMLGAQPAEEDDPRTDPADVNPGFYDLFGFGQPGQGPPFGPHLNPHDGPVAAGWDLWPKQQQMDQHMNNPLPPVNPTLDNAAIPVAVPGEPFLELNDLINAQDLPFDLNEPVQDDLGDLDENPDLVPLVLDMPMEAE